MAWSKFKAGAARVASTLSPPTAAPKSASRKVVGDVTAGAISVHPSLEQMVICEMEPLIPRVVSTYFRDANHAVADNPKVRITYDDARHYVLTTREKFDIITSDPIHPWVKGAATLYTKEYFEHVKAHLNPGGVVTVFVQLYESNLAAVKSEVSTFLSVFKNGMVFANEYQGGGYDVVLLGQKEDTPIDIDAIEARLARPEYAPMRQSLAEIGFYSATELFSTIAAHGPELAPWMADALTLRSRRLSVTRSHMRFVPQNTTTRSECLAMAAMTRSLSMWCTPRNTWCIVPTVSVTASMATSTGSFR